jgi:DMSO/TMAO reductase YedYZ heme-binding membrane subunit
MEKVKKAQNPAWKIIFWVSALSIVYAILRYHIAGSTPWKDFPFFILNKAISLSAFILLTFNFAFGPLKNLGVSISNGLMRSRRIIGIVAFIQVFIHMIMSLMIFKPQVLPRFFTEDGTMNLITGISMVTGVFAFIFLWMYNVSFNSQFRKDKDLLRWINSRKVLLIAMFLAGAHLFFMGYEGWMRPGKWYWGLPPVSLISFAFFFVGYIINIFGREDPE